MSELPNPLLILFSKKKESIELYRLIQQIESFMKENDINPEIFEELIDIKATFNDNNDNVEENLDQLEKTIEDFSKKVIIGITSARLENKRRKRQAAIESEGVVEKSEEPSYTVAEVAKKLGMSRQAIDQKIRNGELPAIKVSTRKRMVSEKALQEYLEKYNLQ